MIVQTSVAWDQSAACAGVVTDRILGASEDPFPPGCRKNPVNRLRTIATRGDTPMLALSILTGAIVATVIAGFEYVSATVLLDRVLHRPLWQIDRKSVV